MTDRRLEPLRVKRHAGGRFEYGTLTFWAEGGGVYMLDACPGDKEPRKSITLIGWKERINAQRILVKHIESKSHQGNSFEKAISAQDLQIKKDLLNAMEEVARQVAAQGDIMDPAVQAYYKNHVAKVSRTFQVQTNILPH